MAAENEMISIQQRKPKPAASKAAKIINQHGAARLTYSRCGGAFSIIVRAPSTRIGDAMRRAAPTAHLRRRHHERAAGALRLDTAWRGGSQVRASGKRTGASAHRTFGARAALRAAACGARLCRAAPLAPRAHK